MGGYRGWLDRALSLVTVIVGLVAAYVVVTERVVPALRVEPVAVEAGVKLEGRLEFELLTASPGVRVGERVGGLGRGRERIVVPGEEAALLLVYSSRCPACYANLSAWEGVVRAAEGVASVLSVALERDRSAARAYARRHLPSTLAVVPRDARRLSGALGIGLVPSTVLVGGDGVVLFLRQGSLDGAAVDTLLSALEALRGPKS